MNETDDGIYIHEPILSVMFAENCMAPWGDCQSCSKVWRMILVRSIGASDMMRFGASENHDKNVPSNKRL